MPEKTLIVASSLVCCVCCLGLLLMAILLPLSIHDVPQDEIAIEYNRDFTREIGDEVLEEGRHYLTPASSLFRYERTVQTIDIDPLECLSSEGLSMSLTISVQYQFQQDNLHEILNEFGEEDRIEAYIESISRDGLKDVCGNFSGEEFFTDRGLVQQRMQEMLVVEFADSRAYTDLILVQLINVAHPPAFVTANRARQDVAQLQDQALNERVQAVINAETRLLDAIQQANIMLINANATANGIIAAAQQRASAERQKWTERATAFSTISSELGTVNVTDLIASYARYAVLINQPRPIVALPSL